MKLRSLLVQDLGKLEKLNEKVNETLKLLCLISLCVKCLNINEKFNDEYLLVKAQSNALLNRFKINHNLSYTLEAMSSFTSDLKVAENYSGSCYPVILRADNN